MAAMLWMAGALLMFGALCAVPFFAAAQLRAVRHAWAGLESRGQVPVWHRLRFHAAQVRAIVVAGVFGALGISYLYLVGLHLGLLRPWP